MQEETTTSGEIQQQSSGSLIHQYYETGREILSKPNLLCDVVESLQSFPVLIYCNTPSDTDFVEVMLKKRGINTQKLIGNVPQEKIDTTFELIKSKKLSAIVLTDIAARLIDIKSFELAINYSVPQDADLYLERSGIEKENNFKNVITLVSPLELANFHFLKKSLSVSPELAAEPSQENILKARLKSIKDQAIIEDQSNLEKLQVLVNLILDDQAKEKILAFLLHNTINVLPTLKSQSQKSSSDYDEMDFDEMPDSRSEYGRSEYGRSEYGSGNRGRNSSRSNKDSYRSRGRGNYEENEFEDNSDDYPESRPEGRSRHTNKNFSRQIKKDARVYLNLGSQEGINNDKIIKALGDSGMTAEDLKHISIRKNYSFFDIDDEKSDLVIENIKNFSENPTVVKAITINALSAAESDDAAADENQATNSANQDESLSDIIEDEADNIGNR